MTKEEKYGLITGTVPYCSDAIPGLDLWKRIKKHLISPERRFAPLGFLGGPISLAFPEDLSIEYTLLMTRQIPFAMRRYYNATEFLLVGHDCGYYDMIPHRRESTIPDKEADIIRAVACLNKHFPRMRTSAFFAEEDNDGFRPLSAT